MFVFIRKSVDRELFPFRFKSDPIFVAQFFVELLLLHGHSIPKARQQFHYLFLQDRIGFARLPHTGITHLSNDERDQKRKVYDEAPMMMMLRANNTLNGVGTGNITLGPEPIE